MKISVLQWNVLYLEKADNILGLIRQLRPDVVCLQELTQNSLTNPNRDIPAEIAGYGYGYRYEATSGQPDLILGNGIFSKFPLLNHKSVYLTREDPANTDFPQYSRAYLEAELDAGQSKLTVATAHLSYSPEFKFYPAKQAEADQFLKLVESRAKGKYILTGDFNAMPDSELIKSMDKMLVSAGPGYDQPTWTTKPFELHGFKADQLKWRLDYVYVASDVKVISSKLVETEYSDHLPILTVVDV
jgi:endonuclease/exonuclease/phosphatase family metal-dependent hydrolase